MPQTITKETVFPPKEAKPTNRAEITDRAARAIIQAETEARDAKTRRLREARLEMEAEREPAEVAKPRARKTPAKTGRTRRSA